MNILDNQISILEVSEVIKLKEVKETPAAAPAAAPAENNAFYIDDELKASWTLKKLREITTKESKIKQLAANERAIIDKWESNELKNITEDKLYFEGILKEYFKNEREKDKRFKLSTPWGKVSTRKSKKWNWTNEDIIKEFLKSNDLTELIRKKEEINKADFKKIFPAGINLETGEVIQGLTIEEIEEVTIKVEV